MLRCLLDSPGIKWSVDDLEKWLRREHGRNLVSAKKFGCEACSPLNWSISELCEDWNPVEPVSRGPCANMFRGDPNLVFMPKLWGRFALLHFFKFSSQTISRFVSSQIWRKSVTAELAARTSESEELVTQGCSLYMINNGETLLFFFWCKLSKLHQSFYISGQSGPLVIGRDKE